MSKTLSSFVVSVKAVYVPRNVMRASKSSIQFVVKNSMFIYLFVYTAATLKVPPFATVVLSVLA